MKNTGTTISLPCNIFLPDIFTLRLQGGAGEWVNFTLYRKNNLMYAVYSKGAKIISEGIV